MHIANLHIKREVAFLCANAHFSKLHVDNLHIEIGQLDGNLKGKTNLHHLPTINPQFEGTWCGSGLQLRYVCKTVIKFYSGSPEFIVMKNMCPIDGRKTPN